MADKQPTISSANSGMNLENILAQIKPSQYSFALNAVAEGFNGEKYTIQNEGGSVLTTVFPTEYFPVHAHHIIEQNIILFWLTNGIDSEFGKVDENTSIYSRIINATCLGFNKIKTVISSTHKVTSCSTEIYWADGYRMKWIDLNNLPYKEIFTEGCAPTLTTEIDCNKLYVQPDFSIPQISVVEIDNEGELTAGTYQFGIEYANALSETLTSVYSITNPISIFDINRITQDFNYKVNKSIKISITDIDITGLYSHFNLIVVETINNISTPYLVGTYDITAASKLVSYTGQNQTIIPVAVLEMFQKFPIYTEAKDVTTAQDVLIWDGVATQEEISYQKIWNKIQLQWQTVKLSSLAPYADGFNTANYKGYFRDEVYALEGVFLLTNGFQTGKSHIPGRPSVQTDLEVIFNDDVIQNDVKCAEETAGLPKWKIYNTATVLNTNLAAEECGDNKYQYGDMAYTESTDLYPCNEQIWGELSNKPIRHHKMPDSSITHIHDNNGNIYPLGIKIDIQQVVDAINNSDLTQEQKNSIQGFKITRANRANNKSVVARGLINNVLKYSTKDNPESISSSIEKGTEAQKLIDTASKLLIKAKKAAGISNINAFVNYHAANEFIISARPLNNTTPEFTSILENAISVTNIALNSTNSDESLTYGESALEILNTIKETSQILSELEENVTSGLITEDFLYFPNYLFNDVKGNDSFLNNIIKDNSSKSRVTFHSPDTSFYQPSIGNILKLETAEFGTATSHIKEVKNHAKYQFVNSTAYITALLAGVGVGFASGTYGLSNNIFNGQAAFTAYQAMIDIIFKVTPYKNYAYQYNSVGKYNSFKNIDNKGNKQRKIDVGYYLNSGIQSVGDDLDVNNYQRESSVYIKTNKPLPYTHEIPGVPSDVSNAVFETYDVVTTPISSYYATIKKNIENQYGQIYSYESIDTGFQSKIDVNKTNFTTATIFGGDCFINKFAYKSKIPFFTDNRINPKGTNIFPNDSDISYNELNNIGKAKYWFSTDVVKKSSVFAVIFGVKSKKFFWQKNTFFYDNGLTFLFAYGIPHFYTESEVNVDMRQAFNNLDGNFYPKVGTGIPDEWLQETNVSINFDNTYYYNKTFSKQNKENLFTSVPLEICTNKYPFRAIFSEEQKEFTNLRRNSWLVYKPAAKFDFPQNYGKLISLDGIEDRQVLARFENKTLLYNALLTMPSSSASVYLGQSLFNQNTPPIDFSNTDLGYIGTQHRLLLKTEFGNIVFDAKRGQIFSLQKGGGVKELSTEGVTKFLNEYLPFQIVTHFPDVNIDNAYNGIGLSGVYDNKYNRLIFTKLDFKPLRNDIKHVDGKFYVGTLQVELTDTNYFCNYSFTLSYSFDLQSWTSYHSYIPNYYVGGTNKFYAGTKEDGLWKHNTTFTLYNNFFGRRQQYIIEYPIYFKGAEEILQDVKDYSKILKHTDYDEFVETDDVYFSHAVIYNNQQCSGTLKLTKKPKNSLAYYTKYPKYYVDEKEILYTKNNSFYQFNTFWALNKNSQQPMWIKVCDSIFKEINNTNMNYSKGSHNKAPIVGKDVKIRLINNSTDEHKFISEFLVNTTQNSYK